MSPTLGKLLIECTLTYSCIVILCLPPIQLFFSRRKKTKNSEKSVSQFSERRECSRDLSG